MVSLYQASVPMLIKYLRNFHVILTKAEQHCVSKGIDAKAFLTHRLIADMAPLLYQVQSCSDTAKYLAVRVGGMENIVLEDKEETFEELHARIDKTIEILSSLKPNCMDGDESREILMVTKSMGTFIFNAADYVLLYAIPNFHFHMSSAYCIVRSLGVPVGAFDYLDSDKNLFKKV